MLSDLIYDGQCGVCSWSLQFLKKRVFLNGIQAIPSQSVISLLLHERYGLNREKVNSSVYLFVGERTYEGAGVYFKLLRRKYRKSIFLPFVYLFHITYPIAYVLYGIVARNRTAISRMMGLDACDVSI